MKPAGKPKPAVRKKRPNTILHDSPDLIAAGNSSTFPEKKSGQPARPRTTSRY
jgi:hypothetical protein